MKFVLVWFIGIVSGCGTCAIIHYTGHFACVAVGALVGSLVTIRMLDTRFFG